jgi:uncharacterized protein (TIGR02996 family)
MPDKDANGLFVQDGSLPPHIRERLTELVAKGYAREYLVITPKGTVLCDLRGCDDEAHAPSDYPNERPHPLLVRDQGFWQAIAETPEDDVPRLVYSDWLEDHGEPDGRVAAPLPQAPQGHATFVLVPADRHV